ncbi:bifunctional proline dehydrogenase/L-glutamate gamma-semialdehyde dehydrogenase PutA [Lutibaculum baratangense]|uniref:Bifunctional protein PutA n=1 Tax=Lutibaculum baratangense AMV1 TaxID=631454 RepID=V4RV70_9HYPH|nr:bifunctional proline dehydrogenase/L-glutamate gamma-semialdehyde dehydrogenase PutA [Lutibaculum baratangense]ESR26930.1 Proline dehydrogenase (Proline oxidase) [Lutibaculum baratangense AMV1]
MDQKTPDSLAASRRRLRAAYLEDEAAAMARLVEQARLPADARAAISARAADLVREVRGAARPGLMEEFLAEYGLSTKEGVALMCLAEALLRVPDAETIDDLIQDKISPHDWGSHLGQASSSLVNASTWALMLTGRVIDETEEPGVVGALRGMVRRLGEPVVRTAVARAMREMGAQFVLGRNIEEAMRRGQAMVKRGYTYSYDMLGEGAKTEADAQRYHGAYAQAIAALATQANSNDIRENPGISVKLSALHPRYEFAKRDEMLPVLVSRTLQLAQAAKAASMGFNIDAEEADRLDLSLDVIERVLSDPSLRGWDGFGVVVQAYGQRTAHAIDWLHALAERLDRRIMVRLVKGAYWDTEIKRAQVLGLPGYPVFTRKAHSDVSYIACARLLLDRTDRIYPQFATHNAHTVAAVLALAEGLDGRSFEFQRLHGMGEALHDTVLRRDGTRCRIYAPVGAHRDLLAYLVRRLLENGANSSFVHQIVDEDVAPEAIARDPFATVEAHGGHRNPAIPLPAEIFGPRRKGAKGWDLTDPVTIERIDAVRGRFAAHRWHAAPTISGGGGERARHDVRNPARLDDLVGTVEDATEADIRAAFDAAEAAQGPWGARPAEERAAILERAADLYEETAEEFMALAGREAGKILLDGVAEVREAVDFLRYYALQARELPADAKPRGTFVCISPWNFPLAIFTGQVAAALVTGNAVLAKPAEQTPLIAARAVELLHEAGVPREVLHLLPGDGPSVGRKLTAEPRLAGVCFTGSTEVAQAINRQLAETARPDAVLIAETGGLNAMIVDSTALPEQAVRDILASSFQSAGQRCSALRMLYVQADVEERFLEMLFGAMETLKLGDPWQLSTDVGPVIDQEARDGISGYCREMEAQGRLMAALDEPADGLFVAPHVFRLSGIEEMEREVFGPVLHVARFRADELDRVVDAVNAKGYGLTFGVHTRVDARVQRLVDRIHVGNVYVNRNQIGAVVGSQPFGGEGLSGTGPKAGGPNYLPRFMLRTAGHGTARLEAAAADASAVREASATLDGAAWAARPDRISALRQALRGRAAAAMSAAAAIDQGPVDLPGPTGESNRLLMVPRGRVLCLGPDPETLLAQAVQALAAGNEVVAVAPGATGALAALKEAKAPLRAVDGALDPGLLKELPLDAVALAGPGEALKAARRALSGRKGPIVPVIDAVIAPAAYYHERAICIDTTAAGGNTTLFAAVE